MKSSKKLRIYAALALLFTIVCLAVVGCSSKDAVDTDDGDKNNNAGGDKAVLDYSDINVDDYVKAATYKGLVLTLESEDDSKEELLWAALLKSAVVEGYPEGAVDYYFEQTRDYYMFIANNDPEAYRLLLENRGMTEEDMTEDAKQLVKKDLVYLYVVKKEGISISDDEKQQLFDKYVAAYVSEYGYTADYVRANMSELIYESMLYDKTLEFLILNNTFEVRPSNDQG